MTINNKYSIGQTVYLITDDEQLPRLVTGLVLGPASVTYELSCGVALSRHYDFEITIEKTLF